MPANTQEILAEIRRHTVMDGDKEKLACAFAFLAAKKCGVAPRTVGDVCNDNKIKIKTCQLGCFE